MAREREDQGAGRHAGLEETLGGATGTAELAERLVRALAGGMGDRGAGFAIPTDDGRHLLFTSEGLTYPRERGVATLPLAEPHPLAHAVRSGGARVLATPEAVRAAFPLGEAPACAAAAVVPVPVGAGVAGALLVASDRPRAFDRGERAELEGLARVAGQAFERAHLEEAARTARTRLVVLAEASARFLEAGPDRGALLLAVARLASEASGDPCLVAFLPEDVPGPPLLRLHHPDHAAAAALASPAVALDVLTATMRRRTLAGEDTVFLPVTAPEALAAAAPPGARAFLERHPVRGLVAAPLRAGGQPFGVVAILRHRPHAPFTMDDRLLVEGLADRAAVALAYLRVAERERAAALRQALLAEAARAFARVQGDLGDAQRAVAERAAAALSARCTVWTAAPGGRVTARATHPPAPAPSQADEAAAATALAPATRAGPAPRTLALPLRVEGACEGALTVTRPASAPAFAPADAELLAELADHAALALAHARKRAELVAERQRLAQVLQSAEVASRAKDEFIAMLSHELRNPLSPIVTALHLMRLHEPGAAPRERAVIERHVAHLVRLVDDLLDVSRVMRGKIRLQRRVVLLTDVVGRAVEQASPLLEARRHALLLELDDGLRLDADEHRIAQVIANLLTNAAKYTDPGGRIVVRAGRDGNLARVDVVDTGIGISPVLLPRVFDLFVQGERTLDRTPGGLGIGLTIVRSLVDLHGGRVAAESGGPAGGSTFTVWLPLVSAPLSTARERAQRERPRPSPGAGAPVLVVDDNEDAAELLAEALRERGHEVAVAFDGPSALGLLARFSPRVALLDLGLPVMDGYELARRLRALPAGPAMGLVAVTGYGQEPDRRASAQAGFDHHLVKPVDLDAVCDVVDTLVARPQPRAVPPGAAGPREEQAGAAPG
jgi:signal transduction histidine kinase/CheY-like chemotaxis protein